MTLPQDQLDRIKSVWPDVQITEDGGKPYVLLPSVRLPDGCTPAVTACLICPYERDGYPCRLFLADRVNGPKQPNWTNPSYLAGRTWQAYSLKLSNGSPTLYDIVYHFLRVLA